MTRRRIDRQDGERRKGLDHDSQEAEHFQQIWLGLALATACVCVTIEARAQ